MSSQRRIFIKNSVVSFLTLCALCSAPSFAATKADAPAQKTYTGDMKSHVTKYEDTLPEIARQNDIGFNELRSANPYVDPWIPGANVKMVIPTRHILPNAVHRGVVINLPEMRLYIYGKDGRLVVTHPIGIGREGLMTPVGQTTVVRKVVGPIWRPTPRMLKEHPELKPEVGPGPDNPMGTHALYLGWPQYAIHGTDKPYAIGRRASSGCIRMYPEDIKATYPLVPVGETVTVVNEPVKAAWINGRLYLEAHPPLDQAMMIEEEGGHPYYDMTDDDMREILRVAGDKSDLIDWVKVRSVIRNREGYPVSVADESAVHGAPDTAVSDVEDHAQQVAHDDTDQDDQAQSDQPEDDSSTAATNGKARTPDETADDAADRASDKAALQNRSDDNEKATAVPVKQDSDAAKADADGPGSAKADVKADVKPAAKKKAAPPALAIPAVRKPRRDLDDPSDLSRPKPAAKSSSKAPAKSSKTAKAPVDVEDADEDDVPAPVPQDSTQHRYNGDD